MFKLSGNPALPLYVQVREMVISAILEGYIKPGDKIPSSRQLAQHLKISRNIVIMGLQQLIDDSYIIVKNRSGYYINPECAISDDDIQTYQHNKHDTSLRNTSSITWGEKVTLPLDNVNTVYRPPNWQHYSYPFIYGQIATKILPITHWQECIKLAGIKSNLPSFTTDNYGSDNPILIDMIRNRLLPKRYIKASNDEILITMGAQNAIYLIAHLLGGKGKNIVIEDPCYCEARYSLATSNSTMHYTPLDNEGMIADTINDSTDIIYTTPAVQSPTNIAMSDQRKLTILDKASTHNCVIIEDDYDSQLMDEHSRNYPIKSYDNNNRVIYVGSLSKSIFPGIRIGYIVADAALIKYLRTLRALMMRHPPYNNQHAVGLFLSLGYYHKWTKLYHHILDQRRQLIEQVLAQYPLGSYTVCSHSGASLWLNLGPKIDAVYYRDYVLQKQVVIEAGTHFFNNPDDGRHYIRLGYGYIDDTKIEQGIKILYNALHDM